MTEHTMPPLALGQRHTGAAYKASTFVQSVYLEEPSLERLYARLGATTASFCTDMGAELGIADFMGIDIESLLPEWMRQGPPLIADGGYALRPWARLAASSLIPSRAELRGSLTHR
jgi:hypothetical protein